VPRGVRGPVSYRKNDGKRVVWTKARLEAPIARPPGAEVVADGDVFFLGGPAPFGTAEAPFSAMEVPTGLLCAARVVKGYRAPDEVLGRIAPVNVPPVLGARTVVGDGAGYDRERFFQTLRDDAEKLKDIQAWSVTLWPAKDQTTCALALAGDIVLAGGRPSSPDGKPVINGTSEVVAFEATPNGRELGRVTIPGTILRNSLAVDDGRSSS
jgi:hypothetical protein